MAGHATYSTHARQGSTAMLKVANPKFASWPWDPKGKGCKEQNCDTVRSALRKTPTRKNF